MLLYFNELIWHAQYCGTSFCAYLPVSGAVAFFRLAWKSPIHLVLTKPLRNTLGGVDSKRRLSVWRSTLRSSLWAHIPSVYYQHVCLGILVLSSNQWFRLKKQTNLLLSGTVVRNGYFPSKVYEHQPISLSEHKLGVSIYPLLFVILPLVKIDSHFFGLGSAMSIEICLQISGVHSPSRDLLFQNKLMPNAMSIILLEIQNMKIMLETNLPQIKMFK